MRLEESVQNPCMAAASIWSFGQHSSVLFERKNWCPCPWDPEQDLSTRISEQRSTEITQWVLHWSSVLHTLRICCSVQWIIQGIVFWTDAPQFYARNAWPGIENHSPQKTNSVHASRDKALLQKSVLVSQFFWSLVWFKHSWFCIHWVVPLIEWKVKTPNLAWY